MNTRRDAMRAELIGAMNRRHQRRRMTRPVVAVVGLAALAGLLVMSVDRPGAESDHLVRDIKPNGAPFVYPAPAIQAAVIIEVQTDPGVLDRYNATGTGQVQVISDEELLAALGEVDRPTGLIRESDAVRLTDDVFDRLEERSSLDG
jgi:hypothetical protein